MNIGFITIDYIILFVITLAFFFISFRYGKSLLVSFILSFYPAYLVYQNFSYISSNEPLVRLIVFIVIFAPIYMACRRAIATSYSFSNTMRYIQATLLSASCTFILLFIYYKVIPSVSKLYNFSASVDSTFGSLSLLVWLVVPIAALLIASRD